jgi:transmembrane 9 superfamily protein 2/4
VKVIKLDSIKTQLPYDYYSVPFCRPPAVEESAENLGEVLSGDRIENSMYKVIMDMEESCQLVCRAVYSDNDLNAFAQKIDEEYRVNWLLDNIPAATKYYTAALPSDDTKEPYVQHYEKGFALGFVGHADVQNSEPGVKYLNNHLRLIVFYHTYAGAATTPTTPTVGSTGIAPGGESPGEEKSFKGSRIVGFEVEAYSVAHQLAPGTTWVEPSPDEFKDQGQYLELLNTKNKLATCNPAPGDKVLPQRVSDFPASATAADRTIIFTYDVHWEASEIKWASRWDLYLKMTDSKIHWFSIINSIMIVLFLSGTVTKTMLSARFLSLLFLVALKIQCTNSSFTNKTSWRVEG